MSKNENIDLDKRNTLILGTNILTMFSGCIASGERDVSNTLIAKGNKIESELEKELNSVNTKAIKEDYVNLDFDYSSDRPTAIVSVPLEGDFRKLENYPSHWDELLEALEDPAYTIFHTTTNKFNSDLEDLYGIDIQFLGENYIAEHNLLESDVLDLYESARSDEGLIDREKLKELYTEDFRSRYEGLKLANKQ